MYKNMNLYEIILLNFLSMVNVYAKINAREELLTKIGEGRKNDMKLGNISRAKRAIMSLCSNNKLDLLPCTIHSKSL